MKSTDANMEARRSHRWFFSPGTGAQHQIRRHLIAHERGFHLPCARLVGRPEGEIYLTLLRKVYPYAAICDR
jgi:hypothetical protein